MIVMPRGVQRAVSMLPKFFPGWYVAVTLAICGVALYGGGLYSFILFVTPLSAEFHWSRAATGTLVSAFWLASPIVLLSDRLLRRYSVLQLVIAGALIESTCLVFLFTATELWQMYVFRSLAGVGKMLYAISIPAMLGRWFSRRFGMALAIVYCGWHIGGLTLAPLTQYFIDTVGWRSASTLLGGLVLIIALPPSIWFLRTKSAAEIGIPLDGVPGSVAVETPAPSPATVTAGDGRSPVRQVFANKAFLLFTAATFLYTLSYSGVLAHQAATVEGSGISGHVASLILGSTAGFAVVGALLLGWLIDRYRLTYVIALQFALMVVGVLCLLGASNSPNLPLLILHAAIFGFGVGGTDIFLITVLKRRIPEPLFPTAYGIWYFVTLSGTFAGPGIAGWLYDLSGSYQTSLIVETTNLVIPFVLSMLVGALPAPEARAEHAPA